jgi:hypothetical protein
MISTDRTQQVTLAVTWPPQFLASQLAQIKLDEKYSDALI